MYYEIIGYPRDGSAPEYLYRGDDYCTVSDTMPNQGDKSQRYARVDLYEDGRLIESNTLTDALEEQTNLASIVVFVFIAAVILYFVFVH